MVTDTVQTSSTQALPSALRGRIRSGVKVGSGRSRNSMISSTSATSSSTIVSETSFRASQTSPAAVKSAVPKTTLVRSTS